MWNIILILILALSVLIVAAIRYGESRWESSTRELRGRLEAARVALPTRTYSEQELEGLPAPVQRYFRTALTPGQPMIEAVSVEHAGTFNMSETGENWRSFVSKQRVIVRRPGFDWDARIRMAPGVNVYVHDAYVAGEGILHAALFGLATLVNMRGTPEAARGELMRFFVEAAWYPTALLPSHGVKWEAVDDTSAKATMSDGAITLTLLFRFDKDGLIQSARAEARERVVGKTVVLTPWEGRFYHYEQRNGMRIPLQGEVAWQLPQGLKTYWRGRITSLNYEFGN